jgi:ankyrin repeat protein
MDATIFTCLEGHLGVVKLLIEKGAGIMTANNDGWMPLHYASENGHVETVRLLLNGGSDVEAMNKDGQTPLYMASLNG